MGGGGAGGGVGGRGGGCFRGIQTQELPTLFLKVPDYIYSEILTYIV